MEKNREPGGWRLKSTTFVVKKSARLLTTTTFVVYICQKNAMPYHPSDAELEILAHIWNLQPVTVREVHDKISLRKKTGYTTVLKQIQRLTEKGVLVREVSEDGTHRYRAAQPAAEIKRSIAASLLQTAFGGSAVDLLLHAIGQEKTSREELEALKKWLDDQMPPANP